MATRCKRKISVKRSKKSSRPFAFQAYVEQEDNKQTIRQAAEKREMSVSQFLIFSALEQARNDQQTERQLSA